MSLTPRLRKLVLSAHVIFAVGWLGAVVSFLALAIAGLTSQDAQMVRATYLAMEVIARFVIVPLSLAPLLTGPILSLGTPWGLFRHYWILSKLLINIVASLLLLLHIQVIDFVASAAAQATLSSADLSKLRIQLVFEAVAALLALLLATGLAVYKPRGMTPYGRRKQREQRMVSPAVDVAI